MVRFPIGRRGKKQEKQLDTDVSEAWRGGLGGDRSGFFPKRGGKTWYWVSRRQGEAIGLSSRSFRGETHGLSPACAGAENSYSRDSWQKRSNRRQPGEESLSGVENPKVPRAGIARTHSAVGVYYKDEWGHLPYRGPFPMWALSGFGTPARISRWNLRPEVVPSFRSDLQVQSGVLVRESEELVGISVVDPSEASESEEYDTDYMQTSRRDTLLPCEHSRWVAIDLH